MATIRNSIELIDNTSPVMAKIANAGINLENKFDRLAQSASVAANVAETATSKFGMLGSVFAGGLMVNAFIAALNAAQGAITSFFSLGDQYAGIQARLQLIGGSLENAAYLNDQIYESAQRARGVYLDTANAVGQLAMSAKDAFPDPREAVSFMEGINKLYAIGGTSKVNRQFATLQLTQGMASGQLQGDEFRSIAENAPIIENMIAKTMGVSRGELKGLASEGKVTAEIIKKSILENMDEINRQFEVAPKQWGDHLSALENYATKAMGPVLKQLSGVANSEGIKKLVAGIEQAIDGSLPIISAFVSTIQYGIDRLLPTFEAIRGGLGAIFKELSPYTGLIALSFKVAFDVITGVVTSAFNFIREHSLIVRLALIGVATALGVMATNSLIAAGRTALASAALAAKTVVDWLETAAIIAMIAAQEGLNAALYACPITWIIGLVGALIGIFYGAVAVINHFAGTSISATGLIFGAFAWLGSGIYNVIAFLWNAFVEFAYFLVNVWADPLGATQRLFYSVWNGIIDLVRDHVNKIIELYNKIPGVTKVNLMDANTGKYELEAPKVGGDPNLLKMSMTNPYANAAAGYQAGSDLSEAGSKLFNFELPKEDEPKKYDASLNGSVDPHAAENAKANKKTAKNTDKIAQAIEMTDDEIKEMRDAAINNVVQSWQNKNVTVNVTNNNDVSSDVDIDGFNSDFVKGLRRAFTENEEGMVMV